MSLTVFELYEMKRREMREEGRRLMNEYGHFVLSGGLERARLSLTDELTDPLVYLRPPSPTWTKDRK